MGSKTKVFLVCLTVSQLAENWGHRNLKSKFSTSAMGRSKSGMIQPCILSMDTHLCNYKCLAKGLKRYTNLVTVLPSGKECGKGLGLAVRVNGSSNHLHRVLLVYPVISEREVLWMSLPLSSLPILPAGLRLQSMCIIFFFVPQSPQLLVPKTLSPPRISREQCDSSCLLNL